MTFIKNSVGAKGKNNVEDVKIVQWLIIRLFKDYEKNNAKFFGKEPSPKD